MASSGFSFFLFFVFIVVFFVSLFLGDEGKLINLLLFDVVGSSIELVFLIDKYSLMFCSVVSLISSVVMMYSIFYMGFSYSNRFVYLVFLFVLSMLVLIFSGNFFLIMLGWDGLGVISFSLVIYYQNEISVKSGLLTIFMNRFGDVAMMFYMCLFFSYGSSSILMGALFSFELKMAMFLFFIGCFSKSAQFPFMSWLPAAMTAPTPVSSLVHSSTLVTAGIYLMLRFNYFIIEEFFSIVYLIGVLTMLVGGMLAVVEMDFSSVIAFSTLSQLGLMVFVLGNGESEFCFFHLLSHAIFKSLLFMVSGIFMISSFGVQDSRLMGIKFSGSMLFSVVVMFSCLNLSGFPISMGFLSSDLILESFMVAPMGVVFFFFFFFSCCLTVCYSIKIFFFLNFSMSLGFSVLFLENVIGSSLIFFMLCFFMCFWGVLMEEVLIDGDFFTFSQDFSVLDFFIFLVGIFFFFNLKFFLDFIFIVLDYFWFSVFLNFFGLNFYKIEIGFIFGFSYYLNYFLVDFFTFFASYKYVYDSYFYGLKNLFFLNFIFILFFLFY